MSLSTTFCEATFEFPQEISEQSSSTRVNVFTKTRSNYIFAPTLSPHEWIFSRVKEMHSYVCSDAPIYYCTSTRM